MGKIKGEKSTFLMQVKNIFLPKITMKTENVSRAVVGINIEEEIEQEVEDFDELRVPENIEYVNHASKR